MQTSRRIKYLCRLIPLALLVGCSQAGSAPTDIAFSPIVPSITATKTAEQTPMPLADTLTRLPTKMHLPDPTPWPEGFTPTVRPTPTRGLAPTATLGILQTCPPPTQTPVTIQRFEDPTDYQKMLLDLLEATGGLNTFQEQVMGGVTDADQNALFTILHEEINSDSVREWMISIRQPFEAEGVVYGPVGVHYRTAVFIFGCRENRDVTLHTLVLDRAESGLPSGLLAVEDLNANGIPEIIVSTVENIGDGGGQNMFAKVLEWDGAAFRETLFPETQILQSSRTLDAVVEFRDVDGSGTQEILVPRRLWADGTGVDCELGPDRNSSAVWMWDGEYYRYMWREFSPPEYRFQAAYDGDYQAFLGLYDRAETSYLRAVFDESLKAGSRGDWRRDGDCHPAEEEKPDAAEPGTMQAYARFRLVELFVRVGRVMEAESHRSYLRVNSPLGNPGYIYAYLANVFWWKYVETEDVGAACAAVRTAAGENKQDVLELFDEYGGANPGPTLDSLCPFTSPPET
jgi:hypothetical protein